MIKRLVEKPGGRRDSNSRNFRRAWTFGPQGQLKNRVVWIVYGICAVFGGLWNSHFIEIKIRRSPDGSV